MPQGTLRVCLDLVFWLTRAHAYCSRVKLQGAAAETDVVKYDFRSELWTQLNQGTHISTDTGTETGLSIPDTNRENVEYLSIPPQTSEAVERHQKEKNRKKNN